jgi:large subunit ribosomal protein L18
VTQGPRARVPFRRRRDGKTDYRKRLNLLKGNTPRAVFRKSLQNAIVQIVVYDPEGDRTVASAFSRELVRYGWSSATGNLPAAYLTGLLAGKRAKARGIVSAVLDIGLNSPTKGSRVFACLKGLLDAGIEIPHDEEVLPSVDRLEGKHLGENVMKAFKDVKAKLEAL